MLEIGFNMSQGVRESLGPPVVEVDFCAFEKNRKEMKKEGEYFPVGAVDKNPPANAGDTGLIPGLKDPTCHRAVKPVGHNY